MSHPQLSQSYSDKDNKYQLRWQQLPPAWPLTSQTSYQQLQATANGSQKLPETFSNFQELPETFRNWQKLAETFSNFQQLPETGRNWQKL